MRLGFQPAPPSAVVEYEFHRDPRAHALDEAAQVLRAVHAKLEHWERTFLHAAEAASRGLTHKKTEVDRLRLEARRG